MGLLEDKAIKSTMKWDEALKTIQEDRRFNALVKAGERKQVFNDYVQKAKKQEKDEERERKKRSKDDYLEALQEWPELKPNSKYRDAAVDLMNEDYWKPEWKTQDERRNAFR